MHPSSTRVQSIQNHVKKTGEKAFRSQQQKLKLTNKYTS